MRDDAARPIRLADYRPPDYTIDETALSFALDPHVTRVRARSQVRRLTDAATPLRLDGDRCKLERIAIDGVQLDAGAYALEDGALVVHAPPARFTLEIDTLLDPAGNTALEGLYMSGGRYCTQCEAEGFRTITYFLDRPDVMARYETRIEAPKSDFPTLLSNGNLEEEGDLTDGRHYAVWRDPHPKPSYLFALAAGRYESIADTFVTRSGRRVTLRIHVDPGEAPRAHYAMDSLKRAMAWDEAVFGREYDLDVFNIVAVRDFNFGAMENKGLNIFNSAYILADSESATDLDYEGIEAVVGHEYFHNWTGDRITCRDWFQLSLKEGLTVFREQEFSADQRSRPVQRIKDVKRLRMRQFPEDAGPLAHPVRPASYQKIDNFYTATVYEKGGEVIRMLKRLIGDEAFARGMDLYFERRDGTASTVEDFIACFADASGRDLSDFMAWYDQAGTPHLRARGAYDAAAKTYALTVSQETPPTPGQAEKRPLPLPLRIGFIAHDGRALTTRYGAASAEEHALVLTAQEETFTFDGVDAAPIPAILRGFSAPVTLDDGLTPGERLIQMAHDPDPFTRWEAGQALAREEILARAAAIASQSPPPAPLGLADALGRELARADDDPAFAALALRMPDLQELIQAAPQPDPNCLFQAREDTRRAIATALRAQLEAVVAAPRPETFSAGADAAGARALRTASLDLLSSLGPDAEQALWRAFSEADTMTESIAALEALGAAGGARFEDALARFYERWKQRPLVIDKWFNAQAAAPRADAIARVRALRAHSDFELRNPNRVRALAASFATRNPRAFHAADGSGYAFLADIVREVDAINAALAARLLTPFETWRRFDPQRQAHAQRALQALNESASLSKNTREMITRTLA
ncbi:MAG: aminopeptidase N [Alphaproteobacteria bacterium]|nr:aminopeptidase N [Alphaproteobacteria bacterium]